MSAPLIVFLISRFPGTALTFSNVIAETVLSSLSVIVLLVTESPFAVPATSTVNL